MSRRDNPEKLQRPLKDIQNDQEQVSASMDTQHNDATVPALLNTEAVEKGRDDHQRTAEWTTSESTQSIQNLPEFPAEGDPAPLDGKVRNTSRIVLT